MQSRQKTAKRTNCSKSKLFLLTSTITFVILIVISVILQGTNYTIVINRGIYLHEHNVSTAMDRKEKDLQEVNQSAIVENKEQLLQERHDFPVMVNTDMQEVSKSAIFEKNEKFLQEIISFRPMISSKEKQAFHDAMKAFHEAVHHNITYFLYGGTLLGSYRHHGMIPWDDDLDLLVRMKDKSVLQKCLKTISPEFQLNTMRKDCWKLFHKDSFQTRLSWRWPFLDIFFYVENDTAIWSSHWNLKKYKYSKKDVFPLVQRPFMGMLLPAPKNTRKMVSMHFDINTCKSNNYNHRKETFVAENEQVEVPCVKLFDLYPFVHRTMIGNKTTETLQGGGIHDSTHSTFVETPVDAERNGDNNDGY